MRLFCLAWSISFLLTALGCGETSDEPQSTQVAAPGIRPPAPGAEHVGNGPGVTFAVTKLFAGDRDRKGVSSDQAWKRFGFNIDGFITDCAEADCRGVGPRCRPRDFSDDIFADGEGGIDNSFGANIVPIFVGLDSKDHGPSSFIDAEIARGDLTLLIGIDRLGFDSDYNPLAARFYEGAKLADPKLDGTDVWPISSKSVSDPSDKKSSRFQFPKSFVTQDVWVSGEGDLTVSVIWFGQPFVLPLHHAIVAMDLSANLDAATNGVISGIVDPDVLADAFRRPIGAADKSLCSGGTIDSILNQVRQSADIMIDGRVGRTDETCDGVSVGLGFEAVRVKLGDVVADPEPADTCAK